MLLERNIKVVKVSNTDDTFNRHYQLGFDSPKNNPKQESKTEQPPAYDLQLTKIINQKQIKRDKKKKEKLSDNPSFEDLKNAGYKKQEIRLLKELQNQMKCQQYNHKSQKNKKQVKQIKRMLRKAQQDLDNLVFLQDESTEQTFFKKQMFSDDSEDEEPKPKKYNRNKKYQSIEAQKQGFYPEFLSQDIILESRQREQNKYFIGSLFLNNPYAGKLISTQLSGNLQVRRENINRASHQSQVYFEVIKKDLSSDSQATQKELNESIFCRIVAIKVNSLQNKQLVGKVKRFSSGFVFEPVNNKIRSMNVSQGRANDRYLQSYYLGMFTSWKTTEKYPMCKLIKPFGKIGDIETQCRVLLQMNNVYEADFGAQTIEYLKKFTDNTSSSGEYIIPKEQYEKRHDLRNELIFTIDPITARDFDDALGVKQISVKQKETFGIVTDKKVYEVGIHIADASYFVEEGSPLDIEAQKRTTSVYLIQRVLPMLPRVLCQTMCSLNPGVERLSLSVWCYIDEDGQVLQKTRFGRSIIQSKARYSYQIAQSILMDKIKQDEIMPQNFGAKNHSDEPKLFQAIKLLNKLAVLLKNQRKSNGSLSIQNHKKQFQLDKQFNPIGYTISQRFQANFLIEQFMLLANVEVANHITNNLGQSALLRRHMFPSEKKITKFKQFMKKFGIDFQISKQTKLNEYVDQILRSPSMKSANRQLIQYQLIFLLQAAEYFIIGDIAEEDWEHYALGYKRYTHFTSPIRRYPDIIVHRQLLKIIETNSLSFTAQQKIASKALIQKCNKCKLSARKVSSGCEKIFMCLYLKKNPVTCRGIITQINSANLMVVIPQYDIRVTIILKDLKNIKQKKVQTQNTIKYLYLKYQNNNTSIQIILRQTQYVNVQLSSTDTFPIDYAIKMIFPHPKSTTKFVIIE